MALKSPRGDNTFLFLALLLWLMPCDRGWSQSSTAQSGKGAMVLAIAGKVEVSKAGTRLWTPAQTNLALAAGDRLRTGDKSRAAIRLADLSILRLTESTTIEIGEAPGAKAT